MIAPVFIIAPSPTATRAFMTACGITTAPSPICELALTTALIMVGVGLQTVKEVNSQLQQRHYEGFLS